MKVAISNLAWQSEHEPAVAALMRDMGVKGVEIAPSKVWPRPLEAADAQIAAHRQFWLDHGVQVVAMQALLYGQPELTIFADDEARRRTLAYLDGVMRVGGLLGAGPLVFGSPKNRRVGDRPSEQADQIAVDFFREAGRRARHHGVTLCIEANPTDYGCDFVTTVDAAIKLVGKVGHPGFGLHLDAGGMTISREPIDATIQHCAGLVRHFHASEPFLKPVGQGATDHEAFARALRGIEFPNWVSVEMRHDPAADTLGELRRVLRFIVDTYGN